MSLAGHKDPEMFGQCVDKEDLNPPLDKGNLLPPLDERDLPHSAREEMHDKVVRLPPSW